MELTAEGRVWADRSQLTLAAEVAEDNPLISPWVGGGRGGVRSAARRQTSGLEGVVQVEALPWFIQVQHFIFNAEDMYSVFTVTVGQC